MSKNIQISDDGIIRIATVDASKKEVGTVLWGKIKVVQGNALLYTNMREPKAFNAALNFTEKNSVEASIDGTGGKLVISSKDQAKDLRDKYPDKTISARTALPPDPKFKAAADASPPESPKPSIYSAIPPMPSPSVSASTPSAASGRPASPTPAAKTPSPHYAAIPPSPTGSPQPSTDAGGDKSGDKGGTANSTTPPSSPAPAHAKPSAPPVLTASLKPAPAPASVSPTLAVVPPPGSSTIPRSTSGSSDDEMNIGDLFATVPPSSGSAPSVSSAPSASSPPGVAAKPSASTATPSSATAITSSLGGPGASAASSSATPASAPLAPLSTASVAPLSTASPRTASPSAAPSSTSASSSGPMPTPLPSSSSTLPVFPISATAPAISLHSGAVPLSTPAPAPMASTAPSSALPIAPNTTALKPFVNSQYDSIQRVMNHIEHTVDAKRSELPAAYESANGEGVKAGIKSELSADRTTLTYKIPMRMEGVGMFSSGHAKAWADVNVTSQSVSLNDGANFNLVVFAAMVAAACEHLIKQERIYPLVLDINPQKLNITNQRELDAFRAQVVSIITTVSQQARVPDANGLLMGRDISINLMQPQSTPTPASAPAPAAPAGVPPTATGTPPTAAGAPSVAAPSATTSTGGTPASSPPSSSARSTLSSSTGSAISSSSSSSASPPSSGAATTSSSASPPRPRSPSRGSGAP